VVFRPTGAICEIWHGGVNQSCTSPCQISSHWCNDKGIGPQKLKLLLKFYQIWNINSPQDCNFHKIFRVYTSFQDGLAVRFGQGVMGLLGFQVEGMGFPQILSTL